MVHANAVLTPRGRLLLARRVVDEGWPIARAAEHFHVSWPTAKRWASRYAAMGRPGGQTLEYAERDARARAAPGAFTAAINWYRAMPLNNFLRLMVTKITVPTMHVFSDGDSFLSPKGAHASGRGVSGEYRFEVLHGVSHWMLDEDPDAVADVLLKWFAAHPD